MKLKINQVNSTVPKLCSFKFIMYGTGHMDCSTCTRIKCVQYSGFMYALHADYAHKNLHELLHKELIYAKCVYFAGSNV